MTTPSKGPASQSTANLAGGPYGAWSGTNQTALIGPAGALVPLGGGPGGGVAIQDGAGNSITSGTALFSNANNVSFGVAGQTITASVLAGSNIALFDGANSISTGTAQFSNANGVSFGFNGQTITASIAAVGGAQTGISSLFGGQNQTVGGLSFSNANGVSFGIASGAVTGTLTASVSQSVQTQAAGNIAGTGYTSTTQAGTTVGATNDTSGLSVAWPAFITTYVAQTNQTAASGNIAGTGFTTSTTGGVVLVGTNSTNGLSLRVPNWITTWTAPSSFVSNINGSSGAISFATGSSLSSSSNGSTITWGLASNITTALQSAGAYLTTAAQSSASNVSLAVAATNNTGGGTASLSGAVSFSNANNLTFYTSAGNAIVASFSTSQSIQTQASGNIAGSGFTTTSTAGTALVGTHNSAGLSLGVPAWLTAAAGGGGIAASIGGNSTSAGAGYSNITSGTAFFMGGPNITLSQNGVSISISGNTPGAAAEQNAINLLGVNTAGNTTATGSTIGWSGINATLSGTNNSQVVISVPATSSLVGTGGISLSTNGNTISVSYNPPNRSFVQIIEGERFTTVLALSATGVSNRPIFQPFWMDGTGISPNTVRMMISNATSSNRSFGGTFQVGIYSAINSTQMTLLCSDSWSISSTVTANMTAVSGVAWVDWINMSNTTFTAEGRYMFGFMVNPVSANITWMPVNIYGADNMPSQNRIFSNGSTIATNSTLQFVPYWGMYSATTAAMPASVLSNEIFGGNSASQWELYAVIKEV